MVEQGTYNDYGLYRANRSLAHHLTFPNADDPRIFEFIASVQERSVNNALVPFKSYADLENYLRLQWAGMFHNLLRRRADAAQVVDSIALLSQVNERIEVISQQILKSVGSDLDRLYVAFLQRMLTSQAVTTLRYIGVNPSPATFCATQLCRIAHCVMLGNL